jgi:8-oxo-dGTP pyrophosphatase MutT (NUDIX family)
VTDRMASRPRLLHGPQLRSQLSDALTHGAERGARELAAQGERARAAVALTVVSGEDGEAQVLVILRAAKLRRHAAQYGLPGGRIEVGEGIAETARRELEEELSIAVPPGGVLGGMPVVASRSGFKIAPVVLWVDQPVEPIPDPVEVQEVYRLPLSELATARVHRLGGGLPVLGTVIFAPTGEILRAFRDLVLASSGSQAAPDDGPLSEPPFTWR